MKYALGVFGMLCDAMRRHNRESRGSPPRKIVLHPEVYRDLANELLRSENLQRRLYLQYTPEGKPLFMNIPIEFDAIAEQPNKLITYSNMVQYL